MSKILVLTALIVFAAQAKATPNIRICWEAEAPAKIKKPLRRVNFPMNDHTSRYAARYASRHRYLEAPWVKNHLDGSATYRFKVITPGNYYVWMRVLWPNSFSNLAFVAVNNSRSRPIGDDTTYRIWHWAPMVTSVRCHRGINTLVLTKMDMGAKVDQILLCSDKDYVPAGKHKTTQ